MKLCFYPVTLRLRYHSVCLLITHQIAAFIWALGMLLAFLKNNEVCMEKKANFSCLQSEYGKGYYFN